MGICCCKRSQVVPKAAPHRGSDDYAVEPPVPNPFSDVPQPTAWTVQDTDTSDFALRKDVSTIGEGGMEPGSHESIQLHPSRLRRRGAICGETLSHYLQDVRWWVKAENETSPVLSDEQQKERDIVRQVLLTNPLFSVCREDEDMLQEVLDAFERQETQPGEFIATPGEMTAFHVVVKGKAVADPERREQSNLMPLQQASSIGSSTSAQAGQPPLEEATVKCPEWSVGEAFGNAGLLYPLSTSYQDASVRAAALPVEGSSANTTITWRLSRVRYQQLLRLHHDDQLRRILRLLSQCSLFQALTPELLFRLCERAEIVTRDAAVPLLQTGDVPSELLVVMSGTVAVEHVCANGLGGLARIQAAVLSPADCVGDEEWLSSGDVLGRASPSTYTYTTQQPVEAVRLSLRDLADLLSPEDVAAMRRGSRNVREAGHRRDQVKESLRALVEQSLLARLSDTDDDSNSEDEDDGDTKRAKGTSGLHSINSYPLGQPYHQESMLGDVTVKGADVTNFLLEHFFARPTYRQADGRERGLSMAAFTTRRSYPRGAVLFDVVYNTRGDAEAPRASLGSVPPSLGQEGIEAHQPAKPDRLYVVVAGEISMTDADSGDRPIFSVGRGGSVGEEGLLPPLRCSTATPLHTRAIVTGADGCEVYELRAKVFKEFLRRPYAAGIRHFCSVFCVLPYAEYFPENYWRFLFHCTTEREVVGGDLVGVRGTPCAYVALLLDGQVKAYREEGTSSEEEKSSAVATFGRGDVVGGREAMEGTALAVAYVCECRTRMLCVPAMSFGGLFHPAMPYLRALWSQPRYEAVRRVQ